MKNLAQFVFLVILASCSDSGVEPAARKAVPAGDIVLQYGEEVTIKGAGISLKFSDVNSDSRCPIDVICIWAGNAGVVLQIRGLESPEQVVVNTTTEPGSVTISGYVIALTRLDPYPHSTRRIEKKDYAATLHITAQ